MLLAACAAFVVSGCELRSTSDDDSDSDSDSKICYVDYKGDERKDSDCDGVRDCNDDESPTDDGCDCSSSPDRWKVVDGQCVGDDDDTGSDPSALDCDPGDEVTLQLDLESVGNRNIAKIEVNGVDLYKGSNWHGPPCSIWKTHATLRDVRSTRRVRIPVGENMLAFRFNLSIWQGSTTGEPTTWECLVGPERANLVRVTPTFDDDRETVREFDSLGENGHMQGGCMIWVGPGGMPTVKLADLDDGPDR